MLRVIHAEYVRGFQMLIQFNNGKSLLVDLEQELDGPIFEPLRELNFFRNFSVVGNTVEWPNGADFAPEFLFEIGRNVGKTVELVARVAEGGVLYGTSKVGQSIRVKSKS